MDIVLILKTKYNTDMTNKFVPGIEPKNKPKINISIRINEDTVDKIDKLSFERNMSRNKFIEQCIDYALQNM